MKKRTVIAMLIIAMLWIVNSLVTNIIHPVVGPELVVNTVNGGNVEATALRGYSGILEWYYSAAWLATLIVAAWWVVGFWKLDPDIRTQSKARVAALIAVPLFLVVGCGRQPYDVPEFVEIGNNETAFVLPLEGDTGNQAKFQSQEYLRQAKVASKRIQITHRWVQEGRMAYQGKYLPTVRVVKIDRSPVTREWRPPETGKPSDTAIWAESGDSIGFSIGISCAALVTEDDSAQFLYYYPGGSLANMMDSEVRARIQQVFSEAVGKYPLDILRSKKQEIIEEVRADVIPFYKQRGITITTVGMFGGLAYENPAIQAAIDKVFVSQQEKNDAQAIWEAQQKKNDTVTLAAQAQADKRRIEAEGEAKAISLVNEAVAKAQSNPVFIQLKALEAQGKLIEKWDGKYPAYFMGGASSPSMLLQVPVPNLTSTK